MINAIVAVTKNGIIGNSGELPWYLPADLKHFKDVTMGHPVIMGRKTYDSILARIGHGLPGRQNIVVTHSDTLSSSDIITVASIESALDAAESDEPFIIGGAQIYLLAADHVQRWYVTEIDTEIDGDVVLEGFAKDEFMEVSREDHLADEKNPFDYSFVVYERR
jgi:dihydrofolate reductase